MNVDESSDEEQEEIIEESNRAEVKRSCGIIYPDSTPRTVWDILLFLFIVYQSLMLPMRISFEMTTSDFIYFLELSIDISFLLDIVVNFNTGFHNKKGQLIMSR